jgi:hypothetical protein
MVLRQTLFAGNAQASVPCAVPCILCSLANRQLA